MTAQAHQNKSIIATRHVPLHKQNVVDAVDAKYLQPLRRHTLHAHMSRHFLALENARRLLALAGGAYGPVRDGRAVRRWQTLEAVPLHAALKALADADAGDVYILSRDKMARAKLRANWH